MAEIAGRLGPPAELRFRRTTRPLAAVRDVWRARELIRTLAERELRARYKQAVLGLAWALITPLALMTVFTLFFDRAVNVQTGGVPYPLFAYLGLLPWTFFSTSVSQGGQSLILNIPLLNKVAFPREVFPMASVGVACLDTSVALVPLGGLFVLYAFLPGVTAFWVPLLLLIQVAFTLGVTLIVSAVVVYLRDLRHALPVLLQIGLFATPVAYPITFIPASLRPFYVVMNPLAAVIDGYRRTLLLGLGPDWNLVLPAGISALALLIVGYLLFKRMETGFADVA
jgi:ABC-type polysaccharide/polyol phosphate export permease